MAPSIPPKSLGCEVTFTINGIKHSVSDNIPADTSLNTYIREYAHLKGTKLMCAEGGCGACIVAVSSLHPGSGKSVSYAVNSCLVRIFSCHGWAITTVEGLGSKKTGYDKVVKRLAAANGTQCGFCSPGMVMNMYSLLQENGDITMDEVENSFGGNICRCTGYRPILDAFKSLASDAPIKLCSRLAEIEDLICPESGTHCSKTCGSSCSKPKPEKVLAGIELQLSDGSYWFQPSTVKEIFEIHDKIGNASYSYVSGNTAKGVYRIKHDPEVQINLNYVGELFSYKVTADGISLGANISLTEAMKLFYKLAKEQPDRFEYCTTLADHIDLIANVPVRNVGSFAGNLAMKNKYKEFPSDIFILLEMVGAKLVIANSAYGTVEKNLMDFLDMDMNKKLLIKILLPSLDSKHYVTKSYKIMPRAQNAHAYVNAGFLVHVDKEQKFLVQAKPTIVFGGINPSFTHATKTENYLTGRALLDSSTLQGALQVLESELHPDHVLPDSSPHFRRGLAVSLFYKFILSLEPNKLNAMYKSGGYLLERPVSSAVQQYETDASVWPLNRPIPKIEALIQCSGEAEYTNDMPSFPNQLWGQLVLTDRANAAIASVDASEALNIPGVVAFFTAKDIPGKNTFMPKKPEYGQEEELIFAEGRSLYAGQAVGIILAESNSLAIKAAHKVKIEYTGQRRVLVDMKEVIRENISGRIKKVAEKKPAAVASDVKHTISGSLDLKGQYHFTMETQTCVSVPTEDHLEVYASTQWPSGLQEIISLALSIPENQIDIRVRRLGGGYGAKLTRSHHTGVASSVAAYLLNRPVRLTLSLESNAETYGKRIPVLSNYKVEVNGKGQIQSLKAKVYEDHGCSHNESPLFFESFGFAKNGYDSSRWEMEGYGVLTDTASNTWCRSPGSTESIAFIENVMEHISKVTGLDPVSVRLANLDKEDKELISMIDEIKKTSDYENRLEQIEQFNQVNRWKKRGISLVPMSYPLQYFSNFHGMVSIFGMDGTVAITHGGIEMGQGINTKAAQVAASILGVPHDLISVKPTFTMTSPNNGPTGGSIGSESVCHAIKVCCEQLNERLKPVREKLGSKAGWRELISEAVNQSIDLNSTYMFKSSDVKKYKIYGVTVTEVEIDILTGQYHTRRVDILEDAGESLSPEVDIGQIEGAFVMGLGYYTTEELVFSPDSGRLLTNRTWNYKPPGAKDIPIDFRVTFRRNAPNPNGVLRSKATGEPPLCMSCSVLFAMRNAIHSARKDSGNNDSWFEIQPPFTGEKVWLGALTQKEMFSI